MNKLIAKFRESPCYENAVKIKKHLLRHPMADSFLNSEERSIVNQALSICAGAR